MFIAEPSNQRIQTAKDFSGSLTSGYFLQYNGTTFNLQAVSGGSGSVAIGSSITGVTAGSLLYGSSGAVLAQDNANLFWDDTNHRLGLGTTTPAGKLDVKAGAASEVPITARGAASQSGDYVRCLDNLGQVEARVLPGGHAWFQGQARIGELTGNGPNYVGLQSPADLLNGNVILTLPDSYPASDGMIPTFSTTGVWSWSTGGSGAMSLAPALSSTNVIQPSAGSVIALSLKGHASQGSTALLEARSSGNTVLARLAVGSSADSSATGDLRLSGPGSGYVHLLAQSTAGDDSTVPVLEVSADGTNRSAVLAKGGTLYGSGLGGINGATLYRHMDIVANARQVLYFESWLRGGVGLRFFSADNSVSTVMAASATGSVLVQDPGTGPAGFGVKAGLWTTNNRAFEVQSLGGDVRASFGGFGNLTISPTNPNGGTGWDATVPLLVDFTPASAMTANAIEFKQSAKLRWALTAAGDTEFWRLSSNSTSRRVALLQGAFADNTDGSYKGSASWWAVDSTAARECIRIQSSGTAPMVGVMGASAAGRQTVTGSRGGNAALASLLTAMATFGWITDSTSA